ncbi:hypothetical protein RhiirA1_400051 [Rhizophagus irregularis]|uniref:Uncharacterized protein n=1 Tax=Rhizophagus irregularis TaxID=588596 RepID=A0A2N0R7N9_9GLOM|nr:hypothetical protein RhiirA1_400051 [Rhizophagus irregularis]
MEFNKEGYKCGQHIFIIIGSSIIKAIEFLSYYLSLRRLRNDYVQAEDNTWNIFDIDEEFEQAEEAYTQAEEKFEKAKDTYDRTHQKRRDRFREQISENLLDFIFI